MPPLWDRAGAGDVRVRGAATTGPISSRAASTNTGVHQLCDPDRQGDPALNGFTLAQGADVLIHDAQYSDDEYPHHVGWGHSSIGQAAMFATLAGVPHLVGFHHDPWHDDDLLDRLYEPYADGALLVAFLARA